MKKTLLFTLFISLIQITSFAQVEDHEEFDIIEIEEDYPDFYYYAVVEEKPEFPGGIDSLKIFLISETKYPETAIENGVQGNVYVAFIIDKEGKVGDVKIMRSIDPVLDEEAIRVVKSMPNWKPGKQKKQIVKVEYLVPIKFRLSSNQEK